MNLYRASAKKIFLAGLFTIFILLLFILTLEFLFRYTHFFGAKISWTSPDPKLGYTFLPGHEYWYKSENDHPITGKINSHGWRDRERSLAKPENTYRIAILGDSFVEALQVEGEATFLSLAEVQLSKDIRYSVEVMNFGRSGYTQTEEFLVLKEHVIKFSPDMVVLFFFPGNDIADLSLETASNPRRPFINFSENEELNLDFSFSRTQEFKLKTFAGWFRQYSALISLLSDRYVLYRANKAEAEKQRRQPSSPGRVHGYLSLCTSNPDRPFVDNYKLTKRIIASMANYCRAKGIGFMLVCCDLYFKPDFEGTYKKIDKTFNPYFFEDNLQMYALSINIEYLGLQRIFQQAFLKTGLIYHWEKNGHWNYEGHRLVAEALVDKLKYSIQIKGD